MGASPGKKAGNKGFFRRLVRTGRPSHLQPVLYGVYFICRPLHLSHILFGVRLIFHSSSCLSPVTSAVYRVFRPFFPPVFVPAAVDRPYSRRFRFRRVFVLPDIHGARLDFADCVLCDNCYYNKLKGFGCAHIRFFFLENSVSDCLFPAVHMRRKCIRRNRSTRNSV